jgi:hypothetical protein
MTLAINLPNPLRNPLKKGEPTQYQKQDLQTHFQNQNLADKEDVETLQIEPEKDSKIVITTMIDSHTILSLVLHILINEKRAKINQTIQKITKKWYQVNDRDKTITKISKKTILGLEVVIANIISITKYLIRRIGGAPIEEKLIVLTDI